MPGGHLRKAEAPAEAEAEKLLGENKTEEKREAFMSLKLLSACRKSPAKAGLFYVNMV